MFFVFFFGGVLVRGGIFGFVESFSVFCGTDYYHAEGIHVVFYVELFLSRLLASDEPTIFL